VTAASAQAPPPEPRPFTVAVTVGSLNPGDLQSQPVLVERLDEEGLVTGAATLDRTISLGGGFRVNGSVAMAMGRSWSARIGGTVGRARLAHRYEGDDAWVVDATAIPTDGDATVSVSGIDLGLRFRIPASHPFAPYLELGVGAERWTGGDAAPFPGAGALADPMSRIGANAAVGVDYVVADRLAVRLQASTRFQRTPLAPLPAGLELARVDTLTVTTGAPGSRAFADAAIEHLGRVRFELGLSYGLGGAAVARQDPPESDASPSAPDR
jgi:hypothetical protein